MFELLIILFLFVMFANAVLSVVLVLWANHISLESNKNTKPNSKTTALS